jgi:hypothetical protein
MEDSTYSKEAEEIFCLLLQKGANVHTVNPSGHSSLSQKETTVTPSQIKENLLSTNQQSKMTRKLPQNLPVHVLRPNLAPIFYAPNTTALKLLLDYGAGSFFFVATFYFIFFGHC